MRISTPTTVEAAAQLLVDLADLAPVEEITARNALGQTRAVSVRRSVVPNAPSRPGDTLWEAITRLDGAPSPQLARGRRSLALTSDGAWQQLPPVLAPNALGQPPNRNHLGQLYDSTAHLGPKGPYSSRRRRLGVLGDLDRLPEAPEATWGLLVTILGAQLAAEDLRSWALDLPVRQAALARDEARAYAEHAAAAEDQLPTSWGWLERVPEPIRAPEAPPTVPALMRVQMGTV